MERERRVALAIVTRLVQEKEYPLAILLMQDIIQKYPNDTLLLSSLGRIHLMVCEQFVYCIVVHNSLLPSSKIDPLSPFNV